MNEKILIVRNDSEDAKALSFLLSGTGYRISSHSDAKSALDAAQTEHYDLAITDRALPENRNRLGLVSKLKENQPKLPVFLLSDDHELDDVIECIRSGVTDVIDEPSNLKRVFEATNEFFNNETEDDDVTWEDMVEVEQALSALFKKNDPAQANADEAATNKLKTELEDAIAKITELEENNQKLLESNAKSETLLAEIKKRSDENGGASAETVERITDLEEREKKLKERESRIAKQKAEAEVMLADLEARQFEAEENGIATTDENASELQQKLDAAQLEWNATRLDLEAQITDLNRELEQAKVSSSQSADHEEAIKSLQESLQTANESIAEKDFILEQRAKEIETLENEIKLRASNPDLDELADAKRLVDMESFKLKEKADKLEESQKAFDDEFEKRQREIEVNKKDAEVSLRELQNKVKEEQLKLQVDEANFKEEFRQFEQAKQNFQEDIEELQTKQSELKQFEDQLKQMQSTIEQEDRALPKHSPREKKAASSEPSVEAEAAEPPKEEAPSEPEPEAKANPDDKFEPKTWNKPPRRRKGNRGPLRIGRSASTD